MPELTQKQSSNHLSPLTRYLQLIQQNNFFPDDQQLRAVEKLDQLYFLLQQRSTFTINKVAPQGIYLWGQVGIGKTLLMDIFYQSLPAKKKMRMHFYQFMAHIHQELAQFSGHKDPLKKIAKKFVNEFKILCLDELFITEIGDGMILYHLLEELFKRGLVLVTTSNFPIDGLYKDDLQPRIFDPAVALLVKFTQQIHLESQKDYRLQQANPQQTYFLPQEQSFNELFEQLNHDQGFQQQPLMICNRPIEVIKSSGNVAWFTFTALCNGPRSQLDYIELAQRFSTILISDIPVLGGELINQIKARGTEDGNTGTTPTGERKVVYAIEDNAARRFISLVDEFYDQKINLYLSAEAPLNSLYCGGSLSFEFTRTRSRLIEMQSVEYLNLSSLSLD